MMGPIVHIVAAVLVVGARQALAAGPVMAAAVVVMTIAIAVVAVLVVAALVVAVVAVIAVIGLRPSLTENVGLSQLLAAVTGTGLVFSLWLTYLELFVIDAICMWCVISAILATALFVICVLDFREVRAWGDQLIKLGR